MILPKKIFFGPGSTGRFFNSIEKEVRSKTILALVSKSVHESHLDRVLFRQLVGNYRIEELSGEPKDVDINRLFKMYRDLKADIIFAVGGGSVIDAAKLLAVCLKSNRRLGSIKFDKSTGKKPELVVFPTTAGSGSEVTGVAIYFESGRKKALVDPELISDYVILDPSYIANLDKQTKLFTLCDAVSHSLESLWSKNASYESDFFATVAFSKIIENYNEYIGRNKPKTEVLTNLQLATMYAGLAFNSAGVSLVHAFAYGLVEQLPVSHGQSVSICLGPVINFLKNKKLDRYAEFGRLAKFFDNLIVLLDKHEAIIYNVSGNIDNVALLAKSAHRNKRLMKNFPAKVNRTDLLKISSSINEKILSHST